MRINKLMAGAVLAAVMASTALTSSASALPYDVVTDFGPLFFTYTYSGGTPLTSGHDSTYTPTSVNGAYTNQGFVPTYAYVYQNISGATINYGTVSDPNNTLWLDPESYTDVTVTFKAPTPGTYSVSGEFLGIDTTGNTHNVAVTSSGGSIYSGTIASGGIDSFSGTVNLSANGTIAFQVLSPGTTQACTYCYLSTGLEATISSVVSTSPTPLPGALALFAGGLGVIGLFSRRKKRGTAATASAIVATSH